MRGPERGRKGSVFCKCFCRYSLDPASICGMTKAGIPWIPHQVQNDQMTVSGGAMTKARSPVRPMGESGKKNDRVGRTREKDEQWKPAFIGQGTGKPEEDSRRGLFERSEFRSPDDGVACDRLGPITAAALLGSFFSLLRRMNNKNLREKKRGDSGRTGRASLLARTVLPAVFFGYKQRVYPGCRVENRVTPHQCAE